MQGLYSEVNPASLELGRLKMDPLIKFGLIRQNCQLLYDFCNVPIVFKLVLLALEENNVFDGILFQIKIYLVVYKI